MTSAPELAYLKREISDLLDYESNLRILYVPSENKLLKFSRYFEALVDIRKISINYTSPLLKVALVCMEITCESDIECFIEKRNTNPQIPFALIVYNFKELNIDVLYESGADYVLILQIPKEADPQQIDPEMSVMINLFNAIHSLLHRYFLYEYYWSNIEILKQSSAKFSSIYKPYAKESEIVYYHNAIGEILNNAFGHLRKPHSDFDKKYDTNCQVYTFVSLWGILNEIISMTYISSSIINDSGSVYCDIKTKGKEPIRAKWLDIKYDDDRKTLFNSRFPVLCKYDKYSKKHDNQVIIFGEFTYSKPEFVEKINGISNLQRRKYPREIIPLFIHKIAGNKDVAVSDLMLAEFNLLNILRNNLYIIHGTISNQDPNFNYNLNLCCLSLFNILFTLLSGEFIEKSKIDFIFYIQKNYLENNMKVRGVFQGKPQGGKPEGIMILYRDVIKKENKQAFIRITDPSQYPVLSGLKENTVVEVFYTITYKKSQDAKESSQWLDLVDIIELKHLSKYDVLIKK